MFVEEKKEAKKEESEESDDDMGFGKSVTQLVDESLFEIFSVRSLRYVRVEISHSHELCWDIFRH